MSVFRCFSPRKIYNRKGELIEVPCGKCDACHNRKNERLRTLCDLEAMEHTFCYFITLSYAPHSIPLCKFIRNPEGNYYSIINCTGRLYEHLPAVIDIRPTKELPFLDKSLFYRKFNLPQYQYGYVPFLVKVDVQLFMKRLRKHLLKYSNEKIRYVAVGEYGPKHFRPHYHLLLWFDKLETQKNIRKAICSSWRYGRVDVQKSKTKLSSYVTKYVNSSSLLSRLHTSKHLKPFALHSSHLGEQFYAHEVEKVYEVPVESFIDRNFSRNGRVASIYSMLSLESGYFPKCYKYREFDNSERLLCYGLYSRAVQDFGTEKVSELARIINTYRSVYRGEPLEQYPTSFRLFKQLTSGEKIVTDLTVLSMLYVSKKFQFLKRKYQMSDTGLLRAIDNYWSAKDYKSLTCQLQNQVDFVNKYGVEKRYNLLWFYSNFELVSAHKLAQYTFQLDQYEKRKKRFFLTAQERDHYEAILNLLNPTYPSCVNAYIESLGYEPNFINGYTMSLTDNPEWQSFKNLQQKIARDAIKHKRQNDANKIFCY